MIRREDSVDLCAAAVHRRLKLRRQLRILFAYAHGDVEAHRKIAAAVRNRGHPQRRLLLTREPRRLRSPDDRDIDVALNQAFDDVLERVGCQRKA
jgi:hypothetical protein